MPRIPLHVRSEAEAAAYEHGYRGDRGERDGWLEYTSRIVPGNIWITARAAEGPYYVAVEHAPVVAELAAEAIARTGPGVARYLVGDTRALRSFVRRVYQLSRSLPDTPLLEFANQVDKLPRSTEAERLVVQRVGQNIFRRRLLDYWDGKCPLTGITDAALLRASHIKPWVACATDAERLDVHNGLLLSSLWDAVFDGGLLTFDTDGYPLFSEDLSEEARVALISGERALQLSTEHEIYLSWHRRHVFQG